MTKLTGPHVALTFDADGPTNWIGSLGATTPSLVSRGEFEPIGTRRVLSLLKEFNAVGTFFVPGAAAELYPGSVEAMLADGHELAHHGYVHEAPTRLSEPGERASLERGLEALERVGHVKAVGYRAPECLLSTRSVGLLLEYGFEYDSSMSGDDFSPYWCRVGDVVSQEEGLKFGQPVPLVEIPFAWHLSDMVQFEFINSGGGGSLGLRPPSGVLEIWKGELDYLCDYVKDGILTLTLHPAVIGRGHRLAMFRAFLELVASKGNVQFTTTADYARKWRVGRKPSLAIDAR